MQVNIKEQSIFRIQILCERSNSKWAGLTFRIWLQIEPVQILIERVHSVMSLIDTVRIQHRHQHKHKIFSKNFCTSIFRQQKLDGSINSVTAWSFSRMYSSCQQYDFFARPETVCPDVASWKQKLIDFCLSCVLSSFNWRNCDEVDVPSLYWLYDNFIVEVDVFGWTHLFAYSVYKMLRLLVAMRVCKGKCGLDCLVETVLEMQLCVVFLSLESTKVIPWRGIVPPSSNHRPYICKQPYSVQKIESALISLMYLWSKHMNTLYDELKGGVQWQTTDSEVKPTFGMALVLRACTVIGWCHY